MVAQQQQPAVQRDAPGAPAMAQAAQLGLPGGLCSWLLRAAPIKGCSLALLVRAECKKSIPLQVLSSTGKDKLCSSLIVIKGL